MRIKPSGKFLLACGVLVPVVVSQAAWAVSVDVGTASGAPGGTVSVSVQLTAGGGDQVAGTQNDIAYDPTKLSVLADEQGKPDCQVNDAINKKIKKTDGSEEPGFAFRLGDQSCDPQTSQCDGIRAIVLSTENVDPIAAGSVLYTCKVKIASGVTAGSYQLNNSNIIASDSVGQRLSAVTGAPGTVTVQSAGQCACDCNVDGKVVGSEITKCVLILGSARPLADCEAGDSNHDTKVSGGDITRGVLALGAGAACIKQ